MASIKDIYAKEENGPRGKSALPCEQRDIYSNLLLLCQKHHKIIDDHEKQYPVKTLDEIKYKGLRDFMTSREETYHFGNGVSEDYFGEDRLREMMGE